MATAIKIRWAFIAGVLWIGMTAIAARNSADWLGWRGPFGNGHAVEGQKLPTQFSTSENVVWSAPVPGRGHSSPIVAGDRLFLTTAREDKGTQSALAYSTVTGELLWETILVENELPEGIHEKNTHASPTSISDGERVFALFYTSDKSLCLFALDRDGEVLWKKNVGVFESEYTFGYGATPVIVDDTVVVSNDSIGTGYLIAYDTASGREVWRTSRAAEKSSFGTLALGEISGRQQILTSGHGQRVAGFDPKTGQELWSVPGGPPVTANTVVWDDRFVYASGGFPGRETWATDVVSGEVVWTDPTKSYEQLMILVDGSLYSVSEGGLMYRWNASNGEIRWRERLPKSPESASLVYAGGYLYHANEEGEVFAIKPNEEGLEVLGESKLGDEIFASPAVVNNRLYFRVANYDGEERSETLYAIGLE